MLLDNLPISRKLTLGFTAVVLIVLAMAAGAALGLEHIEQATAANNRSYAELAAASSTLLAEVEKQNAVRGYVASGDPSFLPRREGFRRDAEAAMDRLDALAADPAAHGRVAALRAEAATVNGQEDGLIARRADPSTAAETTSLVLTAGRLTQMRETMKAVTAAANAALARNAATQAAAQRSALTFLALGALVAAALSVVVGVILTRTIAGPVSRMTTAMDRLAAGDHEVETPAADRTDEVGRMGRAVLTFKEAAVQKRRLEAQAEEVRRQADAERAAVEAERKRTAEEQVEVVASLARALERLANGVLTHRLDRPFAPAYEKLRGDFNAAMDQLQRVMAEVSERADGVRSGSGELNQAAGDLSRRTEQQAAALEETAAALDEITTTVNRTAETSRKARAAMSAAHDEAGRSGQVVREATDAMGGIEASARQIGQIIGVIDEIAFQPNLLALNAGVEAARAGDAGRGFAVVASEVRALAQRSAEAAKEIKDLIGASARQVEQGVDLVSRAGQALHSIASRVGALDAMLSEVAASTEEQAVGLRQVNTAVNQMDQVTQQNAAMVEQTTAACHGLAREADALGGLIGRFETGERSGARAAA
ncbi:MAG TPA: methyl-accepting chemotaxis protein [Caulobacteraceae bacterium]|nr:methyl-accepting chemotaxis protein [Caulobacteraceae bacterium]